MPRTLLFFAIFGLILFCFPQDKIKTDRTAERNAYKNAESLFQQADQLFNTAGDNEKSQEKADEIYQAALNEFVRLASSTRETGFDSLNLLANLRAALICYYLDKPLEARRFYLEAFSVKPRVPVIRDSVFFIPYIYTGGTYHNNNQYDSALFYYNLAEQVQEKYASPLPESERLYNRLGVMLYENGNFRQARNYFEKAIELTDKSNLQLLTNYRINIASIFVKLEDYKKAQQIYEAALPSGLYANEIHHNLAIIHLRLDEPQEALRYLRQTTYPGSHKSLDLYYNYAMAFSQLGERDSSEYYYQLAVAENIKWNGSRKNIPYGLLLKFWADRLSSMQQYEQALGFYQKAIHQFHPGFNESDPGSNPEKFTEIFSFINLFQALIAKARAFENLYIQRNIVTRTDDLISAHDTYESAFNLAHYIERTYDSDEARLFLNKIKHSVHSHPIDLAIQLFRITEERKYLESAYVFDQRNKASVLSLNMQENELRAQASEPLIKRETALRSLITRLSLRAVKTMDTSLIRNISSEIRDAEIELGRIQEEIISDPEYRGSLLTEKIPSIKEIQKSLDSKTALISWHLSEKNLLALIIRGDKFTYQLIPVNANFIPKLDTFRMRLQEVDPFTNYTGNELSRELYKLLLGPLKFHLNKMERLIIIPDDELSYIPFEALQDENKNYFLDQFSILYQFSTHFITRPLRNNHRPGTLAFAPFALRGYHDSTGEDFIKLPASLEEITNLEGTILVDSTGSKKNFLVSANKFGTLHLATHASVNDSIPALSYIAFFPSGNDYKLYAREIYDLRLDSTDLVILSACETGMGKLVKGEGLMSLSRAFAFAGCPNIMMSLWKAEDISTSFITRRLHHYLENNYTKDEALRQAKKDLLNDKSIDPHLKTPNYWAHLMFIGEYEKTRGKTTWWWLVGAIIFASIIFLFYKKYYLKRNLVS